MAISKWHFIRKIMIKCPAVIIFSIYIVRSAPLQLIKSLSNSFLEPTLSKQRGASLLLLTGFKLTPVWKQSNINHLLTPNFYEDNAHNWYSVCSIRVSWVFCKLLECVLYQIILLKHGIWLYYSNGCCALFTASPVYTCMLFLLFRFNLFGRFDSLPSQKSIKT